MAARGPNCGFSENSPTIAESNTARPSDLRVQLQQLDGEIARVEDLLKELIHRRACVKKEINKCSSPVLRIPPEISREIFLAYLRPNDPFTTYGIFDHSTTPFTLGSVCSTWRELAWSMPLLWSSISFDLDHSTPSHAPLFDEWLSRSGRCPLALRLRCCHNIDQKPLRRTAVLEIMDVIARFSKRWCHIQFRLNVFCYEALRTVQGRIPILSTISMSSSNWMDSHPASQYAPFEMFSIAPQLRKAEYHGFLPERIILPLDQLNTLSVKPLAVHNVLKLLDTSSQLAHGRFWLSDRTSTDSNHQVTAHLQSMEIHVTDHVEAFPSPFSSLLDHLSLPDVHELSCTAWSYKPTSFPHLSFTSLISRSHCSLRKLSIIHFMFDQANLLSCLLATPSLIELDLQSDSITSDTIRMLNPTSPSNSVVAPLLPCLQTLSIQSKSLFIDFIELHRLFSTRWSPVHASTSDHHVAQLGSVKIIGKNTWHPSELVLLEQLVAEGMQVTLQTVDPDITWINCYTREITCNILMSENRLANGVLVDSSAS